jgi:hypothetical protein
MEHAPLRPVPARPAGPVDPATAMRELGAWLPTLPPLAAEALALVVLSERPRSEVAASLEVSEEELGRLLAAARKELRQTVITLGGSGWCERAEGLISDRLDGILAGRDTRRLDVHLRNCPRCVEHERRLVQATDALVSGVSGAARGPTPAGEPAPLVAPAPDDGVEAPDEGVEGGVAPVDAAPPDDGIEGGPAEAAPADDSTEGGPADAAPPDAPAISAPAEAAPPDDSTEGGPADAAPPDDSTEGGADAGPSDAPAISAPADAAPPDDSTEGGADAGPSDAPAISAPAEAAPAREQVAAAAGVLVASRTRRQVVAALAWNSLIAIAVLLTLVTIALTIAGILGAKL